MYTLKRAYGVKQLYNSLWREHDVSQYKLFELFQFYRQLYLELENTYITSSIYVNLKDLEADYVSSNLTLAELFASKPHLSLPTVASIPKFIQKSIRYSDAVREGYKCEVAAPGFKPYANVADSTKSELLISRVVTSNKDLHEYCLFTVNGYLHNSEYDKDFLYVLDGGRSLNKSKQNTAGIISFERIAKITKKPITESNITRVNQDTALSKKAFITIPDEFINQSIMLSLGGYLVTPEENTFFKISDNIWVLNVEKLDIVGRYFESRDYLDYSSLNLTKFNHDLDKISLVELLSDEVLLKYFSMSQSFFIAVNTPDLVYKKHFIRHSSIANQYLAYSNPVQPLFLGRGRQADYWKEQEEDMWSITVENGYRPRLIFDNKDNNKDLFDSGAVTPYHIYENSRAFLLDMITDVQVQ
jgi:hypothetical protein